MLPDPNFNFRHDACHNESRDRHYLRWESFPDEVIICSWRLRIKEMMEQKANESRCGDAMRWRGGPKGRERGHA